MELVREAQAELQSLSECRELEQAVVTVFLHSQPIGRKAKTSELCRLVGGSGPDAIELEKGLREWRETSWFLDDEDQGAQVSDDHGLPATWRLGNAPNLRQMHDHACINRVTRAGIEERIKQAIRRAKSLWTGAQETGAKIHKFPRLPKEVNDNADFRFVILGPEAESSSGHPSGEAKKFLAYTTSSDRPRVYRNSVVLAVPSREGMSALSGHTRSLLGWETVQEDLTGQQIDPVRRDRLKRYVQHARKGLPGMIRQAYGVVVTVNEQNEIHAFKLPGSDKPLFEQIRTDKKTRIVKEGLNPEALLPEGPYDLWQEGDESRLATELKEAFARYPRLPKVLRPGQVTDAVSQGVREGLFVARLPRPDKSFRTWWREDMEPEVVKDDLLEIVLPNRANLAAIDHLLLTPGQLPGLWEADDSDEFRPLPVASVLKYFAGGHVATIPRDGYDDQIPIPACPEGVVLNAVEAGVRDGTLWITNHSASCWKEDLPAGIVIENVKLRPPPDPVLPRDLVKEAVPSAWSNDSTNGLKLTKALRQKRPVALPWGAVRDGINEAIASRWLALTSKSGSVECSYDLSHRVVLTEPEPGGTEPPPRPVTLSMTEIQALAEAAPDLLIAIGSAALAFTVSVSADGAVTRQDRAKVDAILATVSPALKLRD